MSDEKIPGITREEAFRKWGWEIRKVEGKQFEEAYRIGFLPNEFPTLESALDYLIEHRPKPTNCEHSLRELCDLLNEMGFSLYQDDSVENAEWEGYRLIDPEGGEHPIDAYTFFDLGVCGL